ncbi:MAG: hypothetical protein HUU35_11705, partial [Armatimonadetes bacterium]|nr:hypothetical protein [Armatimonadota bacterium]
MLAWLSLALLTGVMADDGFVPLTPVGVEDEPWGQLIPLAGPPRDGAPTEALRWQAAKVTAPNSPPLLRDFSGVEALRFWLYLEAPLPFKLNLVMMGRTNGYFNTAIPLDFSGWRQVTLPLASFVKVREADWTSTTTLGFRSQGYGQPALDPGLVVWLDQFEVQPKPGATLTVGNSLEDNRRAWSELAARGNPLLLLNAQRYQATVAPFAPPTNLSSAWTYRT